MMLYRKYQKQCKMQLNVDKKQNNYKDIYKKKKER